jgi:hypothetical protein
MVQHFTFPPDFFITFRFIIRCEKLTQKSFKSTSDLYKKKLIQFQQQKMHHVAVLNNG